jgi:hypothetical protein
MACEQSLGLVKSSQFGIVIQRRLLEVIEEWVGYRPSVERT